MNELQLNRGCRHGKQAQEVEDDAWICCQIGAREEYVIPRILRSYGMLHSLITDVWAPTYMPTVLRGRKMSQKLLKRFHPELAQADVRDFKTLVVRERLLSPIRENSIQPYLFNRSFTNKAAREIIAISRRHKIGGVFAYSYAAFEAFEIAKQLGLSTVLGQIDAGPLAEEIYDQAYIEIGSTKQRRSRRPPVYWESWRKECEMADMIVVNSQWSKRALEWANIPANKITVIPVAFDVKEFGVRDNSYESIVPARFSSEEPLRIAFVGSVSVEKGIHHLLKAANELKGELVQFEIVELI
jgi:glycosyltransferase involved in cell wall biosynthesis